jgi:hypothetical protein
VGELRIRIRERHEREGVGLVEFLEADAETARGLLPREMAQLG